MKTLIVIRHGESQWNLENRFTGWTDVPLSETGRHEAREAGKNLIAAGCDFDLCYTSYLRRAIHTLDLVLDAMDRSWLPVVKAWELNERHYGALQGLNKAETAAQYGSDQVKIWRRSYDTPPPFVEAKDERNPALQLPYRGVDASMLPLGESLADTVKRTVPYFEREILPKLLRDDKRILIVAHGNSLRALVKQLEGLSAEEIMEVNIPTGIPLRYELDEHGKVLRKEYLADPDVVAARIQGVANQGKAK